MRHAGPMWHVTCCRCGCMWDVGHERQEATPLILTHNPNPYPYLIVEIPSHITPTTNLNSTSTSYP